MDLQSVDFKSIVHQKITSLMALWQSAGFFNEDIQETATQFFQMGMIAAQQIQQEKQIQLQGSDAVIPYTPDLAEQVVIMFLDGMNIAVIKTFEYKLPSNEKWQIMQNVAYHVFERSKMLAVVTINQDTTPDAKITDEQILEHLNQVAIEALLYYINEHEKKHGPIKREGEPEPAPLPDIMSNAQPEPLMAPVSDQQTEIPPVPSAVTPESVPQIQPKQESIPEIYHKYAAVALLLNSLPLARQGKILTAFKPEEQQIINQYKDPEAIVRHLDLGRVAKYLKTFKEKLGKSKPEQKSKYASTASSLISTLPVQRLENLFKDERPLVRGYVGQFIQPSDRDFDPYSLPSGVEESLLLYLQRSFPSEIPGR